MENKSFDNRDSPPSNLKSDDEDRISQIAGYGVDGKTPLPHSEKWPVWKKWTSIFTGVLENILFCGIMFGWPNMEYIYQESCYELPEMPIIGPNEIEYGYNCTKDTLKFYTWDDKKPINESEYPAFLNPGYTNFWAEKEKEDGYLISTDTFSFWNLKILPSMGVSPMLFKDSVFANAPNDDILSSNDPNNRTIQYLLEKNVRDSQQLVLAKGLQYCLITFIVCGSFMGAIFDKIGTRYYRFLTMTLFLIGAIIASQGTVDKSVLIYIGAPIMHLGGQSTYSTNLRLYTLFPKIQGLIMQFLNGGFEASACTLLIAKAAYQGSNLAATTFWLMWGLIGAPYFLVRTLFFMPKYFIREAEEKKIEDPDAKLSEEDLKKIDPNADRTFFECLKCKKYFFHIFWFAICDFWNSMFIVSFLSWSSWLSDYDDHKVNKWIDTWSIFQFCGMPCGMLVGIVFDFVRKKRTAAGACLKECTLQSIAVALSITTSMALLASLFASFKVEGLQYITFFCQLTFRASLYGNNATALMGLYPRKHFAKLYGITFVLTIIHTLCIDLIIEIAQHDDSWDLVFKLFTILIAVGYSYPAYLIYKSFGLKKYRSK